MISQFNAFNLCIDSKELYFPELIAQPQNKQPDVVISFGDVTNIGLKNPTKQGVFFQTNHQEAWINVPNIARFLITNGESIIIDPYPKADESSIRAFVLTCCFQALLTQQGLCVMQGNAIQIENHVISFLAPSGFGKSILCHLYLKQGYQILADDICAIDSQLNVLPSYPNISLWSESANQLNIDMQNLTTIRPQIDKYAMNIMPHFYTHSSPIKVIYLLDYHKQNTLSLTPLTARAKIECLKNKILQSPYSSPCQENKIDTYCQDIARQTDIVQLLCPRYDFSMRELGYLLSDAFNLLEKDSLERGVAYAAN